MAKRNETQYTTTCFLCLEPVEQLPGGVLAYTVSKSESDPAWDRTWRRLVTAVLDAPEPRFAICLACSAREGWQDEVVQAVVDLATGRGIPSLTDGAAC